jgi:hypothetical protein
LFTSEKEAVMHHLSRKQQRRLREQNIRAFKQKGLLGLMKAAEILGVPDQRGCILLEIGSSSIKDPQGHVARIKQAMGIVPSYMDTVWAMFGDSDASLYIGFFPGKDPVRIHPQLWLHRFVSAMPQIEHASLRFIDAFCAMILQEGKVVSRNSYPEPELKAAPSLNALFPLQERTLH